METEQIIQKMDRSLVEKVEKQNEVYKTMQMIFKSNLNYLFSSVLN